MAIEYRDRVVKYIADEGPDDHLLAVLAYLDAVISGATS